MKNRQEKIFEKSLQFYKEENVFKLYFYRPTDATEVRKFSQYEKPCDFWFFDTGFVAIECKFTASDRIANSKIKPHQIESMTHFSLYGCRSYLFLSMNLKPKGRINKSQNFAVNIEDYNHFRDNYRKSLIQENYQDWSGIPIEYVNELGIYNLDPIMSKSHRLFEV